VREFVAVDVDGPGARSHAGPPSHLTLRFLGEVAPDRNSRVAERLVEVARASAPFVLRLEGIGVFPSPARPRVAWVGVTTGRAELVELARKVRVALEPDFGAEREEFVPHLTLFRVRSPSDLVAARELLSGLRSPPPPREAVIRAFQLKESVLGRAGAVHRVIAEFPLTGGPSPGSASWSSVTRSGPG
jgi:2'-5' RNA ligase